MTRSQLLLRLVLTVFVAPITTTLWYITALLYGHPRVILSIIVSLIDPDNNSSWSYKATLAKASGQYRDMSDSLSRE